ncbi:hypothetical protein CR513_31306, partial [Mucuna pruriens]
MFGDRHKNLKLIWRCNLGPTPSCPSETDFSPTLLRPSQRLAETVLGPSLPTFCIHPHMHILVRLESMQNHNWGTSEQPQGTPHRTTSDQAQQYSQTLIPARAHLIPLKGEDFQFARML